MQEVAERSSWSVLSFLVAGHDREETRMHHILKGAHRVHPEPVVLDGDGGTSSGHLPMAAASWVAQRCRTLRPTQDT